MDDIFSQLSRASTLVPAVKSAGEVQEEATKRSHAIHASYRTLGEIVERHEKTIQTRWAKKSKQKRLKILLDAWPGMAPSNRADWWAAIDSSELGRRQGAEYRDGYLWPSINQEALLKPTSLLLLLHARARHHPNNFAAADIAAVHFGLATLAILPAEVREPEDYVMVFDGATSPDTYGKLMLWDDLDGEPYVHLGRIPKQFTPGEGLLVLEIQEKMLNFLLSCCWSILQDIPPAELTSDKFPVQSPPQLKSEATSDGYNSLAVMAAEVPYRLPAHIDFVRMELALDARAAAARDHIWAMREDPGYFVDCVNDARDHQPEILRDTDNNPHPISRKGYENATRSLAIKAGLLQGYFGVEFFTELHRQAKELHILHDKYASRLSAADNLSLDFLEQLLIFRHHLKFAASALLGELRDATPASPPLRRFFARPLVGSPTNWSRKAVVLVDLKRRTSSKTLTKVECRLLRLLQFLSQDSPSLHFLGFSLVLDDLEHLVQSEPEAADLVSPRVAQIISDISLLAQCRVQLDRFHPWARTFELYAVDRRDALDSNYVAWNQPRKRVFTLLDSRHILSGADLRDDFESRFYYPAHKRPTKDNIEALRKAENHLDAFWEAIDHITKTKWDQFRGTSMGIVMSEKRTLYRTPEWVDNETAGKKGKSQKTDTATSDEALRQSFAAVYLGPSSTEPAGNNKAEFRTAEKTKVKTKGLPSAASTEPAALDPTPTEEPTPRTIAVDARALKVFRSLFFNPGVTSSPGEVPWLDFVHAMTSAGFAAEKQYGSAWQFQRRDSEGQSSIQFHQPHPRGKISFTIARRMGRRLTRSFGWTASTFVLKDNKGSEGKA